MPSIKTIVFIFLVKAAFTCSPFGCFFFRILVQFKRSALISNTRGFYGLLVLCVRAPII